MNLRSFFRRKAPPIPAPPPVQSVKNPRRRRVRRWILVLSTVTLLGLTRNQWPLLMERIDLSEWVGANAQARMAGILDSFRPELGTLGNVIREPANTEVTPQGVENGETVGLAASTPTAEPTPTMTPTPVPEVTPTPVPWGQGTTVYAVSTTEFTYLWMEPGTSDTNLIAERYESGTAFQIIEPGRGYSDYPVQIDGTEWWRLQAEDGLVGWVEGSQLTTEQLMRG